MIQGGKVKNVFVVVVLGAWARAENSDQKLFMSFCVIKWCIFAVNFPLNKYTPWFYSTLKDISNGKIITSIKIQMQD